MIAATRLTKAAKILLGEILVGQRYEWNFNRSVGQAVVEVIRITTPQNDERRIVTKTIGGARPNFPGEEAWNDESHFRDVCIRLKPDGSRDHASRGVLVSSVERRATGSPRVFVVIEQVIDGQLTHVRKDIDLFARSVGQRGFVDIAIDDGLAEMRRYVTGGPAGRLP